MFLEELVIFCDEHDIHVGFDPKIDAICFFENRYLSQQEDTFKQTEESEHTRIQLFIEKLTDFLKKHKLETFLDISDIWTILIKENQRENFYKLCDDFFKTISEDGCTFSSVCQDIKKMDTERGTGLFPLSVCTKSVLAKKFSEARKSSY